ncbi:MAG: hypothetical protein JWP97_2995 [Labilithrix sp.]|nr:hypothetical protein [Labilithrix sp.]
MLRVYEVSLDIVRELTPFVREIARQDKDLADQLKRARSSVPLNISEGRHALGARRNVHYGYARGSAQETIGILETAEAAGYIRELPVPTIEKCRRVIGTLTKCLKDH